MQTTSIVRKRCATFQQTRSDGVRTVWTLLSLAFLVKEGAVEEEWMKVEVAEEEAVEEEVTEGDEADGSSSETPSSRAGLWHWPGTL